MIGNFWAWKVIQYFFAFQLFQQQQKLLQEQEQQRESTSIRGVSPCPSHDEAVKLNKDGQHKDLKKGAKKLDEETKQVNITDIQ